MTDDTGALIDPAPSDGGAPRRVPGPVVVGIGASAGGLGALRRFLATVPPDTGLAFVVVVHLSPEHESHLADLLQPNSPIPVAQVTGDTRVEPNQVYVIPPGRNLSAVDSHLRLTPQAEARADRAPIDHFLRTLADTHDGASIAVILSGTGTDGTQGIRYVREAGGMAIVQDPDEAEFDGMVRSAMGTGLVDRVLPIPAMMGQILAFARANSPVRPEKEVVGSAGSRDDDAFQPILTLLRLRTGHDFLRYKRTTVARRISRRMQMLGVENAAGYAAVLRENAREAAALLDDLLINVTSFFRDPAVFRTLEAETIPALFDGKGRGDTVRVWSVGCATGEEAYSLGMLLLEAAREHPAGPQVQVFATDLHEASLQHGREGCFPESIAGEISPERLERFFRPEGSAYRVKKELRDTVVFATHNLLRDPPFSRIDLISCRNVLIYLQRDMQHEVIDVFHYALRNDGFLLLGTAETLDRSELFRSAGKEAHLYRRRETGRRGRVPAMPLAPAPPRMPPHEEPQPRGAPEAPYSVLHQRMVERHAPPSLLVAPDHTVAHLSEHVWRYLQHSRGEPTSNVFRIVREELRVELRTALHVVREQQTTWTSRPVSVVLEGQPRHVVLRVAAADVAEAEGFSLVVFEEEVAREAADTQPAAPSDNVGELEAELDMVRGRLQAVLEEFEAGQEEMRASTEELQSANEELRSTMEELETSREELQSVNEELQTLNQEGRHKVEELSQLSSDLQNLLQATEVATLFLDRNLRILRFTPRVSDIFNIRHTDRGRPLADLTHRMGYGALIEDARRVLQTLIPVEHEVQAEGGQWLLLRVMPYRTMDDRIEGIVVSIVDVTALKRSEVALAESEDRLRVALEAAELGTWELDFATGSALGRSLRHDQIFGFSELQPEWTLEASLARILAEDRDLVREAVVQARETSLLAVEFRIRWEDGTVHWAAAQGRTVYDAEGRPSRIVGVVADVTERRRAEEEVAQARAYAERIVDTVHEPLLILHPDLRVRTASRAFYQQFHVKREETEGRRVYDLGNGQWNIPALRTLLEDVLPENHVFDDFEVTHRFEELGERVMLLNARKLDRGQFILLGIRDVTAAKRADEALRASEERHRIIVEGARDYAIFTTDVAGRITSWSPGAEAVFGWSAAEATGQGAAIIFTPEDREAGVDEQEREEAARNGVAADVRWHLREDGERIFIEGMMRALKDGGGAVRGFLKIGQDVTHRRQLEEALQEREALRRLVAAEEDERQRISRDMHDSTGQVVGSLLLGLRALKDREPAEENRVHITELEQLTSQIAQDVHDLAVKLRPAGLDDLGLSRALETYLREWARKHGISADLHARGMDEARPAPDVEITVYRIVQEALTNVLKHAAATRVSVLLERRDAMLRAFVEDDGRGFDVERTLAQPEKARRLGLRGMRERVTLLGGTLEIESSPSSGTTVQVRIPLGPSGEAPRP